MFSSCRRVQIRLLIYIVAAGRKKKERLEEVIHITQYLCLYFILENKVPSLCQVPIGPEMFCD
jgi:hypothetical protein